MSIVFGAVALGGDLPAVRKAFDLLQVPLALELHQAGERGFLILTRFEGPRRLFQREGVDRLAASLSVEFGTTLSIHYDDQVGVRIACLFRAGEPVKEFAAADEVWVPMDEEGNPQTAVTRGSRHARPGRSVEVLTIRRGIHV